MHVAEMEAIKQGMPAVCVSHDSDSGATIKDIHMENFTVSVGGRDLIKDCSVTLSFGRHYGKLPLFRFNRTSNCICHIGSFSVEVRK